MFFVSLWEVATKGFNAIEERREQELLVRLTMHQGREAC